MASPTKIILTGASGFIGSRFLSDFKDVYKIQPVNLRAVRPSQIDFSNCKVIVHCAALVHQTEKKDPRDYFHINKDLTVELAHQAKAAGVHQFVFLSTAHVYGDSGSFNHALRLSSESACLPKDAYSLSKLEAEKELLTLQSPEFHITILRSPMVYGECSKGNLPHLIRLIQRVKVLPLGYTKNARSLIYVGNIAHFIHLTIQKRAEGIFLPQDKHPLSIRQISEIIATILGVKRLFFSPPEWILHCCLLIAHPTIYRIYGTLAFDSKASDERIGYEPPHSTEDGMKRLIQSLLK